MLRNPSRKRLIFPFEVDSNLQTQTFGAFDRGGGVLMSHVDFKKWQSRPVEFKGQGLYAFTFQQSTTQSFWSGNGMFRIAQTRDLYTGYMILHKLNKLQEKRFSGVIFANTLDANEQLASNASCL